MATAPPPMAFEPGHGAVWFEAPAGPYQVIVSPTDAGPLPDMAGRACVAPCGMHLPAGQWRVQTRWEGGVTGGDYLGIAAGYTVRRGYEHPNRGAFVPGAAVGGPSGASARYGAGVALTVVGGVATVYGSIALTLGLAYSGSCAASAVLGGGSCSSAGTPLVVSGLVTSIVGPALIVGGVMLARSGGGAPGLARRDRLRWTPQLAVSHEGAYGAVRVEF